MKFHLPFLAIILSCGAVHAERLIPSALDPALQAARDEVFLPWSTSAQADDSWKKLASTHVPIYCEHKGELQRDMYISNPGLGYWVLGGLTQKDLFRVEAEKLKINDTLVSASEYKGANGTTFYWALWANKDHAYLLTDQMSRLGISQARIEFSLLDQFTMWAATLNPFIGFIVLISCAINLLLLLIILILGLKLRTKILRALLSPPANRFSQS